MIIMLSGKAGVGKDTAYKLMSEVIPMERRAFADILKYYAKKLGWDGKKDIRGRKFLQDLGNTVRDYDADTWANIVVESMQNASQIYAITDWRFPNELEVIQKNFDNVITVRIIGRQYDLGENSEDISEHALDDFEFDYYIENDGTIEEFKNKLINVLKRLVRF